jgi:hypothetical protein
MIVIVPNTKRRNNMWDVFFYYNRWKRKQQGILPALELEPKSFKALNWLKVKDDCYHERQLNGSMSWGSSSDIFIRPLEQVVANRHNSSIYSDVVNIGYNGKLVASPKASYLGPSNIIREYESVTDEKLIELLDCLLSNELSGIAAELRAAEDKRIADIQKKVSSAIKKTRCVDVDDQ